MAALKKLKSKKSYLWRRIRTLFESRGGLQAVLARADHAEKNLLMRSTSSAYFECMRASEAFIFPLNNPSVLLMLHCRDRVHIDDW